MFSSKKFSDDVQNHKIMLDELKRRASEMQCRDPVARFRTIAGKAIRHFDVWVDGKKLIVKEKQNSVTLSENRAEVYVMLSSADLNRSTVMTAYDADGLPNRH